MVLAVIESNPILTQFVLVAFLALLLGFLLKLLKQPNIIAYIITGVLAGQYGLGIFSDTQLIMDFGSIGLILLLFFLGMEVQVSQLVSNWKISVLGTLAQIMISIGVVWVLGAFFSWNMVRIVTLGFVISLSSTAVVIKLLEQRQELNTTTGQNVLAILLAQDIFIVPMMISLSYMQGTPPSVFESLKQLVGGILIIGLVYFALRKKNIRLPFSHLLMEDHEMQVFFAFALCFGLATLTGLFGISSALGAFAAGIIVSATGGAGWFHHSLNSLRVVFVGLFFISVGMLIDLSFFSTHLLEIGLLVVAVFITNTVINASIFRLFGGHIRESIYAGAMLSQIGEFSFVIGATAFHSGVITDYAYKMIVAVISVSLLLSPLWIKLAEKTRRQAPSVLKH